MNNPQQVNAKYVKAIRKLSMWLGPRVTDKYQLSIQKLRVNSAIKSQQFLQLKTNYFIKRLNKLYAVKLKQNFNTFYENIIAIGISNTQKNIDLTKVKDRAYEAKVKSLRVLSRQWKQKKSQTMYKNKYFTPKSQQTPKMHKQRVAQDVYIILSTFLRNKYLQTFNIIKRTQTIRSLKSKSLYLFNYLAEKRRYWLIHGMQKMKLSLLIYRQSKHGQQISQLDTKLAPIQDAQIQNLKQKQQKLQSALQTVYKQKQLISKQVDDEITSLQESLEEKKKQLKEISEHKDKLLRTLQEQRQKQRQFTFTREEIYYLIYERLLINVKLWMQSMVIDGSMRLQKQHVLEWLTVPVLQFGLDRVQYKSDEQMNQLVIALTELIKKYENKQSIKKSIVKNGKNTISTVSDNNNINNINYTQVFNKFFSSQANYSFTYQQLLTQTKLMHKMLGQIISGNSTLMSDMLTQIQKKHTIINSESLQILD